MSLCKSIAAVGLALFVAAPATAAEDTVIGQLNLKTGNFTRLQPTPSVNALMKTYNGTVTATLTIQIKSPLPANQQYLCGLSVYTYDSGAGTLSADASVMDTATSKVLKCIVVIPYSWVLEVSSMATANARWFVSTTSGSSCSSCGPSREIGGGFASFNPETSTATKLTAIGAM